jgi:hypothetical protein
MLSTMGSTALNCCRMPPGLRGSEHPALETSWSRRKVRWTLHTFTVAHACAAPGQASPVVQVGGADQRQQQLDALPLDAAFPGALRGRPRLLRRLLRVGGQRVHA